MNPAYNPARTATFITAAPPAERLHRARQTAGLLRDQFRVLRLASELATYQDDSEPATMLAQCVGRIGELMQRLERELSLRNEA